MLTFCHDFLPLFNHPPVEKKNKGFLFPEPSFQISAPMASGRENAEQNKKRTELPN
jgi:hypothetical protein